MNDKKFKIPCEYLIACLLQREQKTDVKKRETDQELLKRRKVIK